MKTIQETYITVDDKIGLLYSVVVGIDYDTGIPLGGEKFRPIYPETLEDFMFIDGSSVGVL